MPHLTWTKVRRKKKYKKEFYHKFHRSVKKKKNATNKQKNTQTHDRIHRQILRCAVDRLPVYVFFFTCFRLPVKRLVSRNFVVRRVRVCVYGSVVCALRDSIVIFLLVFCYYFVSSTACCQGTRNWCASVCVLTSDLNAKHTLHWTNGLTIDTEHIYMCEETAEVQLKNSTQLSVE